MRERESRLFNMHPNMARITFPTYATFTSSSSGHLEPLEFHGSLSPFGRSSIHLPNLWLLKWPPKMCYVILAFRSRMVLFFIRLKKKTWFHTLPFEDLKYIPIQVCVNSSRSRYQLVLFTIILCQCRFSYNYGPWDLWRWKTQISWLWYWCHVTW